MTRLHRPVSIPGLLGSTVEGGTPLVLTAEGVVALGVPGGGGGELPDGINPDDLLVWNGAQWLPAPPGGPPLSNIYLKIGDVEDVPPGNAPNDILVWTGTAWVASDPADPPLSNIYLPLTGGTLTGFLTLNAAPTAPLHAATKQYVDDEIGGLGTYREPMPTGVLSGGQMTHAGTVLTVAAGTGIIVNSWDDGLNINPTFTPVSWAEQTIDFGPITDRQYSYPYIDSLGVLGFSTTPPQPNQLRSDIWLGRTPHDISTGNLLTPRPAHMLPGGTAQMLADLLYAVNVPFLFEGGKINPNTGLTFQTEDSRWFGPAESWQQDKDDPNIANNPGADPQPFYYLLSNGTAVGAQRTLVDPANYESPLGTIAPIPGSANRATIQRLYSSISGLHLMEYGQRYYDNLEQAVNSLNIDNATHVTNPYVLQANGTLLAYFIMEKGATDLSNGADVVIIDPSGIPLGGGGGGAHTHDATYLRLDAGNDPMQAALSMGGNLINEVLDPVSAQDAATKFYVDQEIGALPPPFSGNHADLTNVLPDQHHARYTDAEAIAAVGPHFSGDHADLTNVLPDQHHVRYDDSEALAAMGDLNDLNTFNHNRYTDAEAVDALQNTLALYLPLAGGLMTGPINMGNSQIKGLANPTDLQDAVTRAYFEANDIGTVHTVSETAPTNPSVGDVWVDPSALGENEYLPIIGGTMLGDIDMGGNDIGGIGESSNSVFIEQALNLFGVGSGHSALYFGAGGSPANPTAGLEASWGAGGDPSLALGVLRDSKKAWMKFDYSSRISFYGGDILYTLWDNLNLVHYGAEIQVNFRGAAQFHGAFRFKQETNGVGRIGFFSGGWQTRMDISDTTFALYCAGTYSSLITTSGISYQGLTHSGIGTKNQIGFTWSSPNIRATIDNVTTVIIANTSDRRLKTGLRRIDNAVEMWKLMPPVYEYESLAFDGTPTGNRDVGMIADEMEQVYPWMVTGDVEPVVLDAEGQAIGGSYQTIDYPDVQGLSFAVLGELIERIERLEEATLG